MEMNRRGFLGMSAAFAAMGLSAGEKKQTKAELGAAKMRFGVLADVHITGPVQVPYFERALRKFEDWKVDAVLACGDLADYGLEQQLKMVADTWFKVFPNGKGSDGRPVANLLHYGDHDMSTWYVDRDEAKAQWPDDAVRKAGLIFNGDRKAIWERCFKEPWEPIALKTVKGYPFILYHFTRGEKGNESGNGVPGLEEFLKAHTFDPKKPIFFSQHRIPRGTACGPRAEGSDDGTTTRLFSNYPNLVAFSGHAHMSGTCEKSIWQGAFTSIQVPSLRYVCTQSGRENGYSCRDRPPRPPVQTMPQYPSHTNNIHQGFLCTIYEHALVIRRWEFTHDAALGPDWVIPFDSFKLPAAERPFNFAVHARTLPVPSFAPDAQVTVAKTKAKNRLNQVRDMIAVSFPPAVPTADGQRPEDYEVTLEMDEIDVTKILSQHRVYSSRLTHPTVLDTEPVVCLIDAAEFPTDKRTLRILVRPCTVFGQKGEPIILPPEALEKILGPQKPAK